MTNATSVTKEGAYERFPKVKNLPHPATAIMRDFIIMCRSTSGRDGFSEMVAALHYLPEYFTVTVAIPGNIPVHAHKDAAISERIRYLSVREGLDEADAWLSPQKVSAIVSGEGSLGKQIPIPHIIVSSSLALPLEESENGFMVQAGNPEAIASAVLRIARRI